jgi:4-amino-4-deoxy-L-arabinose transferase-like glycosyltransferase
MKHRAGGLLLLALLLVALALRFAPWLANLPLHHDEALYGAWAKSIADGSDPFLLIPWVDKPPLVLYLLAGSLKAFGPSELALRLPGMIAGVLTVWATYGLARRIYGERVALIAAALFALSPFAILFGPTAFADPWLTLFLVSAAWAALAGRPGLAGALVGLAAASKQQGLFAAPLVLALILSSPAVAATTHSVQGKGSRARRTATALAFAVLGFAISFGLVTWWDSLRWHNRPSYWDQSLRTYGGVVLTALADWPQRVREWAGQVALLFGAWWLTLPVLFAAVAPQVAPTALAQRLAAQSVIATYVLGYLLAHIALTFQPWDRYLLPILPLICALAGAGLTLGWRALRVSAVGAPLRPVVAAAAVGLAAYAASLGVTVRIPAGSDIGAYQGVAEAAQFLARQPGRPVVYHNRLGWHLDYYLYGHSVTPSWFDSPEKLASEAERVAEERPDSAQWLALPSWEADELPSLSLALAERGFAPAPDVEVVAADGKFVDLTLYRLVPASDAVAAAPDGGVAP